MLKIKAFAPAVNNMVKVAVEFLKRDQITKRDIKQTIESMLGLPIELKSNVAFIEKSESYIARVVAKVSRQQRPATDCNNMTKISAKVYRDANDESLWTITATEEGEQLLVRNDDTTNESLDRLKIDEYDNETEELLEPDVYAGDYATAITEDEDVVEGFVANDEENQKQFVVDEEGNEHEIVEASQYLSVVPSTSKVLASLQSTDPQQEAKDTINDYYANTELMNDIKQSMSDINVSDDELMLAAITKTKFKASEDVDASIKLDYVDKLLFRYLRESGLANLVEAGYLDEGNRWAIDLELKNRAKSTKIEDAAFEVADQISDRSDKINVVNFGTDVILFYGMTENELIDQLDLAASRRTYSTSVRSKVNLDKSSVDAIVKLAKACDFDSKTKKAFNDLIDSASELVAKSKDLDKQDFKDYQDDFSDIMEEVKLLIEEAAAEQDYDLEYEFKTFAKELNELQNNI